MEFSMIGQTQVGNKHNENQDRIIKRKFDEPQLWIIGVADGISGCSFGGSVARFIMEKHLSVDNVFPKAESPVETLRQYLNSLHQSFKSEFKDMYDMLESGATLSLALAESDGTVHCFSCGDSPIFLTKLSNDQYTTEEISISDLDQFGNLTDNFGGFADFKLKYQSLTLSHGEIITITSDGVENGEILLNEKYEKLGFNQMVCSEIISDMLLNPYADDISITAITKK